MVEILIHAENVDAQTLEQIYRFKNHPSVVGRVAMMADTHFGAAGPIGTTLTFGDSIIPDVVGVDIGCGVLGYKLGDIEINYHDLDNEIKRLIPSGMKHREPNDAHQIVDSYHFFKTRIDKAEEVQTRLGFKNSAVRNQIGTLGGGNHFIEIGMDSNKELWLFIHTGSRNFGLRIANHYQSRAKAQTKVGSVPKGMEYLMMDDGGNEYLRDMKVAQEFAMVNRYAIMSKIVDEILGMRVNTSNCITSVHNYINYKGMCRKGAISAERGENVIIPLNMKDGTVLGVGLGNKLYNESAPHGAGRLHSRSEMKELLRNGALTVDGFKSSMAGIYTTSCESSTIDEAPEAYKPYSMIEKYLKETVDVKDVVKPVYNFKATGV